jgi:hypothetical protein
VYFHQIATPKITLVRSLGFVCLFVFCNEARASVEQRRRSSVAKKKKKAAAHLRCRDVSNDTNTSFPAFFFFLLITAITRSCIQVGDPLYDALYLEVQNC